MFGAFLLKSERRECFGIISCDDKLIFPCATLHTHIDMSSLKQKNTVQNAIAGFKCEALVEHTNIDNAFSFLVLNTHTKNWFLKRANK